MNVYFIPAFCNGNKYLANISRALINNGVNVLSSDTKKKNIAPVESVLYSIIKKDYIVHFNWIENKVNGTSAMNKANFLIIRIWILLLEFFGAKIAWTMHNKVPHRTSDKNLVYSFYKYFLPKCDLIVVHCKESEDILRNEFMYSGTILNIPHGSYIDDDIEQSITPYANDELLFLHFGAISKYKNIPALIQAFKSVKIKNRNVKLCICGRCKDDQLNGEIENAVHGCGNIEYINKFLSDEELEQWLNRCCMVILPYDNSSMLNSGSAIMAFSQGRGVIVSRFGYINDISDQEFVLSYDYRNNEEHIERLTAIISRCVEREIMESGYLWKLGRLAYKFTLHELNWNDICNKLKIAYESKSRKVV